MRHLFRLTESRDDFSYTHQEVWSACQFLSDSCYRFICVRHHGGKKEVPHYHMVLDVSGADFDPRKELKKYFNKGTGNKHHSIKSADERDEALSYLFHENIDEECIVYQNGYSKDEIDGFIALNSQIQAEMSTPTEVCKMIASQLLKDKSDWSTKNIFRLIYEAHKAKGSWLPDRRQAERYLHRIQAMIREDSFDVWYSYYFQKK